MNRWSRILLGGFCLLGALVTSCSAESPKLVPLPLLKKEKVVDSANGETFDPKVDILFVVASDSSMEAFQQNLIANFADFTAEMFKNGIVNYHIGVVSAMATNQNRGAWGGRLAGQIPFVSPTTPNPDVVLQANLNLGSSADDPVALFDVVHGALTSPIANNENAGFLRPDAALAIIFMTDTDPEDSTEAADKFFSFLVTTKNGDAKNIFLYAAFPQPGDPQCAAEGDIVQIPALLKLSRNPSIAFSVCASDYGKKLAAISTNIIEGVGRTLLLSRAPVAATIEVTFGSQIIPNDSKTGWVFDPARNAILFGDALTLSKSEPPGTKVQVRFDTATY